MGRGRIVCFWPMAAAVALVVSLEVTLLHNEVEAVTRAWSTEGTAISAMGGENSRGRETSMGGSLKAFRAASGPVGGTDRDSVAESWDADSDGRVSSLQLSSNERHTRHQLGGSGSSSSSSFLEDGNRLGSLMAGGIDWHCAGGKCMCPEGKRGEEGFCTPVKGREDNLGLFTAGQCSWFDYPRTNYAYLVAKTCTIVDVWAEVQQRYLDDGPYNDKAANNHSVIVYMKKLPTYETEKAKCDGDWRIIANTYCANKEKEGLFFVAQKDKKATLKCGSASIKMGPVTIGTGEACGLTYEEVKAACDGKSECEIELPSDHAKLHRCKETDRVAIFGTFFCGDKGKDGEWGSRPTPPGINWLCAGGKCMCPEGKRGEKGFCTAVRGRQDNLGDYTAGQCHWSAYPRSNYAYIVAKKCRIVDVWAEVQQRYLDEGPYNYGSSNPHSVTVHMKDLKSYKIHARRCRGDWRIIANTQCANEDEDGFLFVAQRTQRATLNCGSAKIKMGPVTIGTGEACGRTIEMVKPMCEGKHECEVTLPPDHANLHRCKETHRVAVFGTFFCVEKNEEGGWDPRPTPPGLDWLCAGKRCMCPEGKHGEKGFCSAVKGRQDNLGDYTAGQCSWFDYPRTNYAYIVAKKCTIVDVWAEVQQRYLDEGPYNDKVANNHSVIVHMKDLPTYETESSKCDGEWRIIANTYCANEKKEGFLFVAQKSQKATLKCSDNKKIKLGRVTIGTGELCGANFETSKSMCDGKEECEIELPEDASSLHQCKETDRLAVFGEFHCEEPQAE